MVVIIHGLFFQELNPWNVLCTITPVILAFLYYLWWWNTVHKSNCRDASATAQSWRVALAARCGQHVHPNHWLIHARWNNRAPKGHGARFRTRPFRLALVASCCAVVCFVKGLDEDNDPARFFHGCGTSRMPPARALLLAALDPVEATRLRE